MKLTRIKNQNCHELCSKDPNYPGYRIYLFSYQTLVAYTVPDGAGVCFKTTKHWSSTTSKHINAFIKRYNLGAIQPVEQVELDKMLLDLQPRLGIELLSLH